MAAIERLIETKDLQTAVLISNLEDARKQVSLEMRYDKISDILILSFVPATVETVVHYLDDHVGLLYEPETLEVVGLQIEGFDHSFMPEHDSIRAIWRYSAEELKDIGELMLVFERKKQDVARELKPIIKERLNARSLYTSPRIPA
ncbi:MAG: hypothetical protein KJ063_23930 [Anaerolineae bacterium]|nr:hypothetical protein [Anaerolineae bacterium]